MWNFSFDDLAKRAQEEAARLAEQAQDAASQMQSPNLFNLDSMNPEVSSTTAPSTAAPSTVAQASSLFNTPFSSTTTNSSTAPPAYNTGSIQSSSTEGNVDHVASLVSEVASPRAANASINQTNAANFSAEKKKSKAAVVTKLSTVGSTATDDFFNSWGDDNEVDAAATATSSSDPIDTINEKMKESANQQINVHDQDDSQALMPTEQSIIQQAAQETHSEENNAWDNDDLDIPEEEDTVENTKMIQSQVTAVEGEVHTQSITEEETPKEGEIQPIPVIENSVKEPLSVDSAEVDNTWDDEIDIPDDHIEEPTEKMPLPAKDEFQETPPNVDNVESHHETESPSAAIIDSEEPLSNLPAVDDTREESDGLDNNFLDEDLISVEEEMKYNEAGESSLPIEDAASTPIVDNKVVLQDEQVQLIQSNADAEEDPWAEDDLDITEENNDTHAESAIEESTMPSQAHATIDDIHLDSEVAEESTKETAAGVDDDEEENFTSDQTTEFKEAHSNDVENLNNTYQTAEVDVSNTAIGSSLEELTTPPVIPAEKTAEQDRNLAENAAKDANDDRSVEGDDTRSEPLESTGELDTVTKAELSEEIQADEAKVGLAAEEVVASIDEPNSSATKEEANDAAKDKVSKAQSNLDQQQEEAATSKIFDGATDLATATQSLQSVFGSHASNLFDTSKSSSMFGWSFQNDTATNQAAVDASFHEAGSNPIVSQAKPLETKEVSTQPTDDANLMSDLYNDAALDDMYDDDSDEEEVETNTLNEDTPVLVHETTQKVGVGDGEGRVSPEPVSQQMVDKFVGQLERMTESHQLEMDELHRTYKLQLGKLQSELDAERTEKKNVKARDAVAAQDKHLSEMRELEKTFNKTLQEKQEELEQVMQRNEGFTLKMDSMRREVDGLLKLVDERDDEIVRLKTGQENTMLKVEGSMKGNKEELARRDAEIKDLKASLSSLQAEFDSTTEHFNTLKSRAKAVATELKDRRIEVRTLSSQNEELTTVNASLETELANLNSQNDQQRRTIGYKDKDIEALNEKVKALNKELDAKDNLLQDKSSVGEKAISSYKRKAQEALAAANTRLAAANQAREEAESDAKAAKTASDDAVERARIAEAKKADAEKTASEATRLLEIERSDNLNAVSDLQHTVDELKETIDEIREELTLAESSKEGLHVEIEKTKAQLNNQKELNTELHQKLIEAKDLCNSLQDEVHNLRDEAQRSSAAAFKRQKEDVEMHKNETPTGANSRAESDGTIIMLQQELQGANDAINELKLALRMALLEKAEPSETRLDPRSDSTDQYHGHESTNGNDSTPLFFAIEKQNELNTARDEINRLANMLGDAESEKQDAFDAMEEMKRKMEEANARLERYEKLGNKTNRPISVSSGYASYRSTGQSLYNESNGVARENDSAVNLEYLKNVMLSYLNARTLAERRKLVPVVATVLCLTPEEQSKAIQSVEDSAGLGGVASSFWENIESKAHNLM